MASHRRRRNGRGKFPHYLIRNPKPLFSEKILHIDHIYEAIFSYSSPQTVIRTRRTCRAAMAAVSFYISREYNVNKLLSRYFPDPVAFRSVQARTATLISGSTALQFFDRSFYPESDLDLYVNRRSVKELGQWIVSQGYRGPNFLSSPLGDSITVFDRAENAEQGDYDPNGVLDVITLVKPSESPPSISTESRRNLVFFGTRLTHCLTIQLIVTEHTPMSVILGFHSTCVMNVISYDKGYCLFPRATLQDRKSVRSRAEDYNFESEWESQREDALQKYNDRGWSIIEELWEDDYHALSPSFGPRWMGDGMSWVVPLDLNGVERPPPANASSRALTHDPVALCSWFAEYDWDRQSLCMHFGILQVDLLQHQYTVNDWNLFHHLQYLAHWLSVLEGARNGPDSAQWTYFDAELPALCSAFLVNYPELQVLLRRLDPREQETLMQRLAGMRLS